MCSVLKLGGRPNDKNESTYLCRQRELALPHLPVRLLIIFLRAQRPVSRQKPWHEPAFRLDLVPCFETKTTAELDIECERGKHVVQYARSLT